MRPDVSGFQETGLNGVAVAFTRDVLGFIELSQ